MGPSGTLKPVPTLLVFQTVKFWGQSLPCSVALEEVALKEACTARGPGTEPVQDTVSAACFEYQETHRVCVLLLCSCFLLYLVIIQCLDPHEV